MLSIESELRSLRNELEGRHKISRETPNSPKQNRIKDSNTRNEDKRENAQNSSSKRNIGNKEAENTLPKESRPSTKKYSDSPDFRDKVSKVCIDTLNYT